jgi:asparagine synthase (glutamine-hydrolysing)
MCGIAGIVCPRILAPISDVSIDANILSPVAPMIGSLEHRGPDDQRSLCVTTENYQVYLGHTRLSIIDLSTAAQQPMIDEASGCILVYNGETYNFLELRSELSGLTNEPFRSMGDTEVLLRAYLHWGDNFVARLRGMFAFAIYDPRQPRLFLGRDHFGIKPLYTVRGQNGQFAFASEVRALLTLPWVSRNLDPLGLAGYLAYGSVQDPLTLVAGIEAVPSGNTLAIDLTTPVCYSGKPQSYWNLNRVMPIGNMASDIGIAGVEAIRRTRSALQKSVRRHLVSDVPLGVFLSSGLDSSAIVALMAEVDATDIHTLTVSFDESGYDESRIARSIAQHFGTQHTEIHLSARAFLEDLSSWLESQDQPSADGANSWVISRAARQSGLTVALSGLGGDELFGGYVTFQRTARAISLFRQIAWMPQSVREMLASTIVYAGNHSIAARKSAEWIRSDGSAASTYLNLRRIFLPDQFSRMVASQFTTTLPRSGLQPEVLNLLHDYPVEYDVLSAVSAFEMRTYLVNTLLRDSDQMGMAHSLEIRVPFVDVELAESIMSLPPTIRFAGNGTKPLLRAAVQDLLKPDWTNHPKMGFVFPFDQWLRHDLRKQVEDGLACLSDFPFQRKEIWTMWHQFLNGSKQINAGRILTLYALATWIQRHGVKAIA